MRTVRNSILASAAILFIISLCYYCGADDIFLNILFFLVLPVVCIGTAILEV